MGADRLSRFNIVSLVLGFAFLYIPILLLVIYSFNASRLVTVWGGFSTRWYVSLLYNQQLIDAAWVTLRVALVSATVATVLGTLAAVALTRYTRFRGRVLFTGMVFAPLVMPEVITGLSLLLFFVAVDLDRGFWTITLAHTTLTMCFVTVVVQSRLLAFDWSLEEAAMDLGAPPLKAFRTVTLPLILARRRDSELRGLDLRSVVTGPAQAAALCDRITARLGSVRVNSQATQVS
jgi:putrescine transport system permease protein